MSENLFDQDAPGTLAQPCKRPSTLTVDIPDSCFLDNDCQSSKVVQAEFECQHPSRGLRSQEAISQTGFKKVIEREYEAALANVTPTNPVFPYQAKLEMLSLIEEKIKADVNILGVLTGCGKSLKRMRATQFSDLRVTR